MKTLFCLLAAAGLFYAHGRLNDKFFDETEAAVNAPMRVGQVRPDNPDNDDLTDPRIVAETPEGKGKLAEARVYKHEANLCLLGCAGFIFIAVVLPTLRLVARRYLPPQQEQPCEGESNAGCAKEQDVPPSGSNSKGD